MNPISGFSNPALSRLYFGSKGDKAADSLETVPPASTSEAGDPNQKLMDALGLSPEALADLERAFTEFRNVPGLDTLALGQPQSGPASLAGKPLTLSPFSGGIRCLTGPVSGSCMTNPGESAPAKPYLPGLVPLQPYADRLIPGALTNRAAVAAALQTDSIPATVKPDVKYTDS